MECLKCKHYAKDRDACIACVTKNPEIASNHHGVSEIGFDELSGTAWEPRFDPTEEMLAEIDGREGQAEVSFGRAGSLTADMADMLSNFLHRLLTLEPREMLVLCLRFESLRSPDGSPTLEQIGAEIATRMGAKGQRPLSKQLVLDLLRRVVAKVPQVVALFPTMSVTLTKSQQQRKDAGMQPVQGFLPI